MNNVKRPMVPLTVSNDSHSTKISSSNNHCLVSCIELDKVGHLSSGQINLDGVIHLYQRVRVADRAPIMGNTVGNALWTQLNSTNTTKFILWIKRGEKLHVKSYMDNNNLSSYASYLAIHGRRHRCGRYGHGRTTFSTERRAQPWHTRKRTGYQDLVRKGTVDTMYNLPGKNHVDS